MLILAGLWAREATMTGLSGFATLFTHGLGWSAEEFEAFLVDVKKDVKNTRIHSYWPMQVLLPSRLAANSITLALSR